MELQQGMAAVVTGGASGLGKASAQALADLGLKVTIFDVNEEAGEAHARAIGGTFALVDITDEQSDYARTVVKTLQKQGVRVSSDLRNQKITYKIREHSMQKIPVIAVVGAREAAEGTVALRRFGSQGQTILSLDEAASNLADEATAPDIKREKAS